MEIVDKILIDVNDTRSTHSLKSFFGLSELTHDDDFVQVLAAGIGTFQHQNWDPIWGSSDFSEYCANITSIKTLYPVSDARRSAAEYHINKAGITPSLTLVNKFLNFAGYVNFTAVMPCIARGSTIEQCFDNHNATRYKRDSLQETWRSWPYQYCTEWGFLQTGSGVPDRLMPLLSRLIDIPYLSLVCKHAFNITRPPNVDLISMDFLLERFICC